MARKRWRTHGAQLAPVGAGVAGRSGRGLVCWCGGGCAGPGSSLVAGGTRASEGVTSSAGVGVARGRGSRGGTVSARAAWDWSSGAAEALSGGRRAGQGAG